MDWRAGVFFLALAAGVFALNKDRGGAPGSGLELSGSISIAAAKERPGFAGYSFGLADDEVTPARQELADGGDAGGILEERRMTLAADCHRLEPRMAPPHLLERRR